jgi:hypothetical protein
MRVSLSYLIPCQCIGEMEDVRMGAGSNQAHPGDVRIVIDSPACGQWLIQAEEIPQAGSLTPPDCRLGDTVAPRSDPIRDPLYRKIRIWKPEEYGMEFVTVLHQPRYPRRKRPAGKRRLEGKTAASRRQPLDVSHDNPAGRKCNAPRIERRQPLGDCIAVDILKNLERFS